jgi:superfamily II DNA or RNA helicase
MEEIATYLGAKGYSIMKDNISVQEQELIRKELTVKAFAPKSSISQPTPFPVYRESPKKLYVPRFYGYETYGEPDEVRISEGENIDIAFAGELHDFQKPIVKKYLKVAKTKGCGLLEIHCGAGKCLAKGTKIMLVNGEMINVENIKVGDKLMGDDSKPRKVLSLARGREMMYDIIPTKGDVYTVNESHILSLKCSVNYSKKMKKGDIIDICVKDYLNLPKTFHGPVGVLLGYRVPIKFSEKPVEMNPYALGYWLGDGTSGYPEITTIEEPVIQYFKEYAEKLGLFIRQGKGRNCITYSISSGKKNRPGISGSAGKNKFLNMLNNYNLIQNKHIPHVYKCNSRRVQLELLAGIIDSDGYLTNNTYDIVQKNERLLDDIIFIARSLGFSAYKKKCKKSCMYKGEKKTGTYYRTCISGKHLEDIPVKLNRKKAQPRKQIKDVLVTRIKVVKKEVDDYYGFEIDGNRRFVLGDFQVTHNTIMALKIISELKKKTLVIVHKEFLLEQWKERISQFLPTAKVGRIQGKIIDIEGKDIVIGMLQSLSMKKYPTSLFQQFGLTICDECHHMGAEVFSNALFQIVTKHMLGLSATMKRKDNLSKVFKMFLGDVVYKKEREANDIVTVKCIFYETDNQEFSKIVYNFRGQVHYALMIKKLCEFNRRSEFILKVLESSLKEKPEQQFIILAHNRNVLKYLHDAVENRKFATVGYYVGGMKQKDLKISEDKKVIIATYAMAEEALDIKSLTSLIMVTPKSDVCQAVGRILRKKESHAFVYDIVDVHGLFQKQWQKRCVWYRKQKFTIMSANMEEYEKNQWTTLSSGGKRLKKNKVISDVSHLLQGVCLLD